VNFVVRRAPRFKPGVRFVSYPPYLLELILESVCRLLCRNYVASRWRIYTNQEKAAYICPANDFCHYRPELVLSFVFSLPGVQDSVPVLQATLDYGPHAAICKPDADEVKSKLNTFVPKVC